jgi:signal transduction histidine kinase
MEWSCVRSNLRALLAALPLHCVIHLLAVSHVLSASQAYVCFVACNVYSNALCVHALSDNYSRLAHSLTTVATAAAQANASRSQFLRYIFHEIRNPLNSLSLGLLSVIGGSEATRGSAGVADDVDEALLIMKDSVNYISDVLNDVLSMHKIEEGVLELVMQSFDMRTAVDAVRRAVKLHAESSLVAIDFSCTDEVPASVIGDRQRFQHAFINILTHFINLAPERSSLRVVCACDAPAAESSTSMTLSQSSLARRTRARLRFTVSATDAQVMMMMMMMIIMMMMVVVNDDDNDEDL